MTLAASIPRTDWITAWATLGAAAGTVFTLVVAVLTLRLQVKASLRQQAARIVVDAELHQDAVSLVVRNMSDLPITDLSGRVYFKRDAATKDIGTFGFFTRWNGLIPESLHLSAGDETRIPLPALPSHMSIGAKVMFRDSSGLSWARQWPSGELRLRERGPRRSAISRIMVIVIFLSLAVYSLVEIVQHGPGFNDISTFIGGLLGCIVFVSAVSDLSLGFRKLIYELGWDRPDQARHRAAADSDPGDKISDKEGG
jgi:hypothetical protein